MSFFLQFGTRKKGFFSRPVTVDEDGVKFQPVLAWGINLVPVPIPIPIEDVSPM